MKIVVGGLGRKCGKTSMVCRILRLYPDRKWVAVKITPHLHGDSAADFTLREAGDPAGQGDTSRYLAAGAGRAFLLEGDLDAAMPRLLELLAGSENWIVESNRAAARLGADFTFFVADPSAPDEEEKLRRFLGALE
jgi:hypothetical protein